METYVLEHLRCVICNQHFANLMQCFNGHSHCFDCMRRCETSIRKKDMQCTICRTKKGWSTNRQVYQIALNAEICLECGVEDCIEKVSIDRLAMHRNRCPCTRFQCPIPTCDCTSLRLDEVLPHVKSHQKVLDLCETSHCTICISELMLFGPKIYTFNEKVIQLSCQIFYDRRFETRMVLKASVLGFKEITDISLIVYQWNMLNDNYSKHVVNVKSSPEHDLNELPETLILNGMKNFIHEPPDSSYLFEQKVDGPMVKPKLPIKVHDLDSNEDCQELHTLSFCFCTTSPPTK